MNELRACLKIPKDAVCSQTLRVAVLLAVGGVGSVVTARCGDVPPSPPCPAPKSLAAAPLGIFRQARRDRYGFRIVCLALLATLLGAGGVRAADGPPSNRFLLVFETSPAIKKGLPTVGLLLQQLFSSNLQDEIVTDDDVAIWTVDEKLRTGTYPLVNWNPDESGMFADEIGTFLAEQKFTRHASLAPIQPLLGRIVKNSDRLTVLIFCDGDGVLSGTPYDSGVNEIIANAAARNKDSARPFIIVLRANHGEYIGCSVNRTMPLNFPRFPQAPSRPAPPVVQSAPVAAPASGPVVQPVAAMIIVGTKSSTNVADLERLATPAEPAHAPAPVAPVAPPSVASTPMTAAAPNPEPAPPAVVAAPPANPNPNPNPNFNPNPTPPPEPTLAPAPVPAPTPAPTPAPVAVSTPDATAGAANPAPAAAPEPATANPANPAPASHPNVPAVVGQAGAHSSLWRWTIAIGAGGLLLAVGIIIGLIARSRQPESSLITLSMHANPSRPPEENAPAEPEPLPSEAEPLPPEEE